jgi:hypothetical protein
MEAATFWHCVRDAWTDAWKIVVRRPIAVAIALAVLLVANAVPVTLNHIYGPIPPTGVSRLVQTMTVLVRTAVMIALTVTVMQQIVLGERELRAGDVFGKEFWRYLRFSFLIGIAFCVGASVLIGSGFFLFYVLGIRHGIWLPLILFGSIAFCLIFFVATRLSLLFCHVAIGGTTRWRATWSDTRGHFWRIAASHFLTALPMQVVAICIFFLGRAVFRGIDADAQAYLFAIAQAFYAVVGMIVGAACSCWLYRRFAQTLLERA